MTTVPTAKTYTRTDLIDDVKEAALLAKYIEIALTPSDDSWTKHDTKDARYRVDFKQVGNMEFWTTRGQATIEGNIHDFYEYNCGGFNDIWELKTPQPMMTESRTVCCIDDDHQICYIANESGVFMVSPRDMCYHRVRFQNDNYECVKSKSATADDSNQYICGTFCYSIIDKKHPFYVKVKDKHARALIVYSGYVCRKISDTEFEANYVLCMDPGGWIPAIVINQMCGSKGMSVKAFHESWDFKMQKLQRRADNNFQRDFPLLFDTSKTNDEEEPKKSQNNNNNN